MNLNRVIGTFNRHRVSLPFAPVSVAKGENGERVIEGVKPFVDSLPNIPWGRKIGGDWKAYSKDERVAMAAEIAAKTDRAAKRAANKLLKGEKASKAKEEKPGVSFAAAMVKIAESQIGTEETKSFPVPEVPQTVKRDGRWVQVGADNLTAHIEAR